MTNNTELLVPRVPDISPLNYVVVRIHLDTDINGNGDVISEIK